MFVGCVPAAAAPAASRQVVLGGQLAAPPRPAPSSEEALPRRPLRQFGSEFVPLCEFRARPLLRALRVPVPRNIPKDSYVRVYCAASGGEGDPKEPNPFQRREARGEPRTVPSRSKKGIAILPLLRKLANKFGPGSGRGAVFLLLFFVLSVPFVTVMALVYPFVYYADRTRRVVMDELLRLWARFASLPFWRTEVIGRERLPKPEQGCVFVANHLSYLDTFAAFALNRPFKFISKAEIFLVPFVGWSMVMAGMIGVKRGDRRSQMDCLRRSMDLLRGGASLFIFPEGTRSKDGRMLRFQRGAFSMAVKAKVPVVPLTILGTADMMPVGKEATLRPGKPRIVVHEPISWQNPDGTPRTADEVCDLAAMAIDSALPEQLQTLNQLPAAPNSSPESSDAAPGM
eukprot:tig00020554_g10843.t1